MDKKIDKEKSVYCLYRMMFSPYEENQNSFTDLYKTIDKDKGIRGFKQDLLFTLYSSNYFQKQRKKFTPKFWRQNPGLLISWAKQNIPKSCFFYDEENSFYYFQDIDETVIVSRLYKTSIYQEDTCEESL